MIGKGRKLIVPVIAIMMCAVALAGVAYAATTTVTDTGSGQADYFVIDLYDGSKTLATGPLVASDFLTIYTTKNLSTGAYAVLGDQTPDAVLGYVAVFDNNPTPVSSPAPTLTLSKAAGTNWTFDENHTFTCTMNAVSTGNGTVTATITISVELGSIDNGYYPVGITGAISNGSFTGSAQAAAATVTAEISNLSIGMVFQAAEPVPQP